MPVIGPPHDTAAGSPAPAPLRPADFESYYREHHAAVLRLVLSLTGGELAVAEELTQEAFVKAHRHWAKVEAHPRPDLWIRRVATNQALSMFRRRRAERKAVDRTASRAVVDQRVIELRSAEAPEVEPPAVARHIATLPRRQAEAIVLVYVDQLTSAEAATVLGCAEGTLRVHLSRARRALRAKLEADAAADRWDRPGRDDEEVHDAC